MTDDSKVASFSLAFALLGALLPVTACSGGNDLKGGTKASAEHADPANVRDRSADPHAGSTPAGSTPDSSTPAADPAAGGTPAVRGNPADENAPRGVGAVAGEQPTNVSGTSSDAASNPQPASSEDGYTHIALEAAKQGKIGKDAGEILVRGSVDIGRCTGANADPDCLAVISDGTELKFPEGSPEAAKYIILGTFDSSHWWIIYNSLQRDIDAHNRNCAHGDKGACDAAANIGAMLVGWRPTYVRTFFAVDKTKTRVVVGATDDPAMKELIDGKACEVVFSPALEGQFTLAEKAVFSLTNTKIFGATCGRGDQGACGVIGGYQALADNYIGAHNGVKRSAGCVLKKEAVTADLGAKCAPPTAVRPKVISGQTFLQTWAYETARFSEGIAHWLCDAGNLPGCGDRGPLLAQMADYHRSAAANKIGPDNELACYLDSIK